MEQNMAPIAQTEGTLEHVVLLLTQIRDIMSQNMLENTSYYDNADLKRLFHFSDSTLHRHRKNHLLPYRKIQGKIFYPKAFFHTDSK